MHSKGAREIWAERALTILEPGCGRRGHEVSEHLLVALQWENGEGASSIRGQLKTETRVAQTDFELVLALISALHSSPQRRHALPRVLFSGPTLPVRPLNRTRTEDKERERERTPWLQYLSVYLTLNECFDTTFVLIAGKVRSPPLSLLFIFLAWESGSGANSKYRSAP